MKSILILFAAFLLPYCGTAQCPEFTLAELHSLQRATVDQKDYTIQSLGFDLRSDFVLRGESISSYSKCWNSNLKEKSVFEQLVWWNKTTNSINFMTLNEAHYLQLRNSILGRHNPSRVAENPDFYIGKMFQYRFGSRRVDEVDYYFVLISLRR